MDPQLKQRLVGAVVLVALAVLLIPVILDGGYREPTAARRDLGPMPPDDFPPAAEGVAPEAAREIEQGMQAAPEALATRTDTPSGNAESTPRAAVAAKPASAPAAKSPPSAARWALEVGAHNSRDKADAQLKRLQNAGVKGYVAEAHDAQGKPFRVRAGPVADRSAALALREKLAGMPEFRGALVRD